MYRKNTAGQFVGVQLVLTATGAIATGLSPTVRRCIDGTFAAGGGTVTEDTGTGGYKYAMAQADTNGNNISLWFTATGAIPVCINFITTAGDPTDSVRFGLTALPNAAASAIGGLPVAVDTSGRVDVLKINGTSQTAGDIFARIGAPAGASVSADIAAVKSDTGTILTDVNTGAGAIYTRIGAPAGASIAADVAAVAAKTTNLPASPAAVGSAMTLTAAYDLAKTASQAGDAMTLTSGERNSTADAFLNRDMSTGTDSGSPTVRTVRQALRFLRNKFAIVAGTMTVYKEDDTTASWTSTLVATAGDPISSSDPA